MANIEKKTFTEEQLLNAIDDVQTEYIKAANVLGIDVKEENVRGKLRVINDVLVKLGYPHNYFYVYLLNKETDDGS